MILPPVQPVHIVTIAALLSILALPVAGDETVRVELTSGRVLTADVDSRTDDEQLWLRFGDASLRVLRPIGWKHVASVQRGEEILSRDQVQALADTDQLTGVETPVRRVPTFANRRALRRSRQSAVSTIDFDAHMANWDADIEVDGLQVGVFPIDADGRLTKVSGTLVAELFVANPVRRTPPRRLARWSRKISAREIENGGIQLRLPFQTVHPEFASETGAYGLLHVRLSVPGRGVFEASRDGIRLRPFSPTRDAIQRATKRRFLSTERTSRGKR